ncbi:MAG: formylmethanofuran dehydrogenase subunit C [Thermogemmata sp.]
MTTPQPSDAAPASASGPLPSASEVLRETAGEAPRVILTLEHPPAVPLEAEVISPDRFLGLSPADIAALPVFHGKRQCRLEDFFTVEVVAAAERSGPVAPWIEVHGDASRVKWLGRGMSQGRLSVYGAAGMHLGAYMSGGAIEVFGRAGDWVGAEMSGGTIHIHGDAGGQAGAAYRGSSVGMRGGLIVIDGSAGIEIGMRMRRGTIVIRGPVRDFAGLQMTGGTIVLLSGAELRTGAWMARGTIVSLVPLSLLPTFGRCCLYQPTFLSLYARYLQPFGIHLPHGHRQGFYHRWIGDRSVPGRGEILVWEPQP